MLFCIVPVPTIYMHTTATYLTQPTPPTLNPTNTDTTTYQQPPPHQSAAQGHSEPLNHQHQSISNYYPGQLSAR